MFAEKQLPQGCRSVTSHLTRRALQVTQASFARFRGGSDDIVSACSNVLRGSRLSTLKPAKISALATKLLLQDNDTSGSIPILVMVKQSCIAS